MKVYVFGNPDVASDNQAILMAKRLQKDFSVDTKSTGSTKIPVEFVFVKPNEDLPFIEMNEVVIMDVIGGLDKPKKFILDDFEKFSGFSRSTVHDFDLGFQLKYLKKLGKINKVKIIGIPVTGKTGMKKEKYYSSIQSIFKKLVAQDMQGS